MAGVNILLTGKPGVGKTTVVKSVVEQLPYLVVGFYTTEIRRKGKRAGFQLISLNTSKRLPLAHIDFTQSQERVGKYGVKPENLLGFLKEINQAINENLQTCLVMDEIGKMEFYTPGFKDTVVKALDSPRPLLGTILSKQHAFCDQVKARKDVEVIEVTYRNRDDLPEYVMKKINASLYN